MHRLATELASSLEMIKDEWRRLSYFLLVSHKTIIGLDPTSPVATVFPAISRQLISSLC